MALDDDPFAVPPLRKAAGLDVGGDLSTLSETEIEERIGRLEVEIGRLRQTLATKRASREAAENVFKR
ncbi:DUF1192 domain-containing protein [Ancylobacter amanitiformis]|uniref:Uncharacterized small protein (DUF1192 family) n=1 Tax=Ancylobacter amanitiformis TaxID=217069 RepID=A0ABU0LNM7_9HYPH|nr:DUF1192 domain-containing protein [Ancylobacter amanitiformis]MDQ0510312.1 uncharacterized small protein (DUF1192 family) [Ancylobacter amanitiformis]